MASRDSSYCRTDHVSDSLVCPLPVPPVIEVSSDSYQKLPLSDLGYEGDGERTDSHLKYGQ